MIVLTYRGRTLEVSGEVIKTFTDMEITRQAKVKEKEQAISGMAAKAGYAEVEGVKADTVSMDVPLLSAAGVDVENEIKEWRALADGQSARLYIAGKDFLGVNVALTGCDATEIAVGGDGVWSRAKLKLTFTQSETGMKPKGTGTGGGSGTHTQNHTYTEEWAVNATTKKMERIAIVQKATVALSPPAGKTWREPIARVGHLSPTEFRAKQYDKKKCPFCKAIEQQKANDAANKGKDLSQDSVFGPGKTN